MRTKHQIIYESSLKGGVGPREQPQGEELGWPASNPSHEVATPVTPRPQGGRRGHFQATGTGVACVASQIWLGWLRGKVDGDRGRKGRRFSAAASSEGGQQVNVGGIIWCFVLILSLCAKLRCHLVSDGQKIRVFCLDRIEVIPYFLWSTDNVFQLTKP
jgi:hypothetical protein